MGIVQSFEVSGRYFNDLHSGLKTHEGRSNESRMFKTTKLDEIIRIVHKETGRWFLAERGMVCHHTTVEGMLICPDHPNMLPGTVDLDEKVTIYRKFGVDKDVVAIKIRAISPITIPVWQIIGCVTMGSIVGWMVTKKIMKYV